MKGATISQFVTGQHVEFQTSMRHDPKPGGQNSLTTHWERGVIVKLHKSCRQGVAEIRPDDGRNKVSRRMQHVRA